MNSAILHLPLQSIMSHLHMSGSLSGSRLATKDDFCISSQISAMRPVLNSTQGPSLYLVSEYPYPKYKSVYPISMKHGETKTITITFLSKDGSGFIGRLTPIGGITGYCSTVLQRLDLEVWASEVTITAALPYGVDSQTCNAILTLSSGNIVTEIALEISVIRIPPAPYVPPPPAVTVPLSVSQTGSLGASGVTPIHRSLGGSGYVPLTRSQIYSPAPVLTASGAIPANVTYSSHGPPLTASGHIQTVPGRYHSDYVYNPALPVPPYYQNEIQRSMLETSLRGSQIRM